MVWSKYNFLFETTDNEFMLYNSLSNYFISIDNETYNQLIGIKNDISLISIYDKEQINLLIEKKILVESDIDEFNKIKLETHLNRYDNNQLSLTIAPTNDCNFKCEYCFEKNIAPIYMNEITENNIINLIKGYNNIKFLQITWYGGEPLMYFKKIISLTNKIKELNIPFNSVIISNGYLLTSNIIYSFEEINLKNIQITLDGTKEKHDKRRPLKSGGNTFDTILNNIDKIFQLNTNNSINITIRVNIDETNKNDFPEIYNLINTKYKSNKNINVYPAFVDDTNSVCTDLKGCIFDRQKVMNFYKEMLEENKIVAFNYFPDMFRQECMSRNINSFVIGADGAVYKCWNDIGVKEKEIFNVNVKGILNNNVLSNYLTGADMLDEKKCQECLMLPICSGGCPFKRLDVLYNKDKDYSEFCTLFKDNLNSYLHTYFKIKETIHE